MHKTKKHISEDTLKDLEKASVIIRKKLSPLIDKKKKLYSKMDIESPMSPDEKKLNKDIAALFSQLNNLVAQKRNIKKESVIKEELEPEDYIELREIIRAEIASIFFDLYKKKNVWAK